MTTPWYTVLKNRREQLGLSVAELARRSSLTRQTIMGIEAGGVKFPRHETISAIATALGLLTSSIWRDIEGISDVTNVPDETLSNMPTWQQKLLADYPGITIEEAKDLLATFSSIDPGLHNVALKMLSGLAEEKPIHRTQHGR